MVLQKIKNKMNYLFKTLTIFVLATLVATQTQAQEGYNIRVKIDNYLSDTCILGYRLGGKTYVKDTLASKNKKGEFVFSGKEPLKGGIYLVLTKPHNSYFEFLVGNDADQTKMVITTKLEGEKDLSKHLKIEGSDDNRVFLEYLKFLADTRNRDGVLAPLIETEKDEAKKKQLQEEREGLGKVVKDYQDNLIKKYPKYLCASLIAASLQPEVPKDLSRVMAFYYFRDHFWDTYDWSDARLIRTPILKDKMEYWSEKLAVQAPDSVIVAVEYMMQKSLKGGNKEVFQYVAAELLNKYAASKVICMDAVYVFLGEKYYCTGKAEWVDSAQLVKICENVNTLKPLLCNAYAPNIRLKKMDGTPINLYDVKAKFTALYFWDPDCGNCGKTSDKLVPVYNAYKKYGFEVFGICSKTWSELDKCQKKVDEKKMVFINTSDEPYPLAVVKKMYDIKVNPFLFLLDENKRIMWKRIDPNQLEDILRREFNITEGEKVLNEAVEKEFEKKEKENEKKLEGH